MNIFEVLFIALGLAMDAFAVAVASGATMKRLHLPDALKMGLFFGGFQAVMPVIDASYFVYGPFGPKNWAFPAAM